MGETIRFGVSLDSDLLERFDELCTERDYSNRSEAIRDLIRGALVENEWENAEGASAATLTLIYDHHKSDLAKKLMSIQHDAHHLIITTLHVHLDHDNCLEVLVLKGPGAEIQALAQRLISTKGVVFGRLYQATEGRILR